MKTQIFTILLVALAGCAPKAPGTSSVTNNYAANPITTPTTGGTTTTSTTTCTTTNGVSSCTTTGANPSGCDGVPRATASKCYYKNIPTVQVSGGLLGQIYWSSLNLPNPPISQNQFVTDASFNVRIVTRIADPNKLSASGRKCSLDTVNLTKKLQVQLMLRKQGASLGEIVTVSSDRDVPSSKGVFTVPGGTTQPYILDVVSVKSDERCTWAGGTSTQFCPYADIPVSTSTYPTDCVAFDIQYSTDDTYDLP